MGQFQERIPANPSLLQIQWVCRDLSSQSSQQCFPTGDFQLLKSCISDFASADQFSKRSPSMHSDWTLFYFGEHNTKLDCWECSKQMVLGRLTLILSLLSCKHQWHRLQDIGLTHPSAIIIVYSWRDQAGQQELTLLYMHQAVNWTGSKFVGGLSSIDAALEDADVLKKLDSDKAPGVDDTLTRDCQEVRSPLGYISSPTMQKIWAARWQIRFSLFMESEALNQFCVGKRLSSLAKDLWCWYPWSRALQTTV